MWRKMEKEEKVDEHNTDKRTEKNRYAMIRYWGQSM